METTPRGIKNKNIALIAGSIILGGALIWLAATRLKPSGEEGPPAVSERPATMTPAPATAPPVPAMEETAAAPAPQPAPTAPGTSEVATAKPVAPAEGAPATIKPGDVPPLVIPPPATPTAEDNLPCPVGGAPDIQPPPRDSLKEYIDWMKANRPEEEKYAQLRYSRWQAVIDNKDIWRFKESSAFLLTPREKFCRKWNLPRAYDHAFLDIKYGVTISGPHLVMRMTSVIDVQPGEKVLEIGTGSGYQSAILSYLTDKVFTIEIIEPLTRDTDAIYADLIAHGYPEYGHVMTKADDGYYGWAENAPFDKIIVTCGIDHIPPELLKQLKVGGVMVIPVGPPGAQVVLKVTKKLDESGNLTVTREDIYQGKKKVPFVPFTKKGGGTWNGK